MIPRDDTPLLLEGDWPPRGRGRRHGDRVGWATWTLCGTLTGLAMLAGLWHGRAAATEPPPIIAALPSAAAGISIQPGTVWVALSARTFYRPDQAGFGTTFPGVFMPEMQAIARGCWPALP